MVRHENGVIQKQFQNALGIIGEPGFSVSLEDPADPSLLARRKHAGGLRRAQGLAALDRNTPTVLNSAHHRWFSWDGRADSLWAQSVQPILDPREMGATPRHVASAIRADAGLSCLFEKAYGSPAGDDERVLVDVGKALAAYVEQLDTGRTPFDELRDALARGDATAAGRYPASARRDPDVELTRYLSDNGFRNVPPVLGAIDLRDPRARPAFDGTVAMVQAFVAHEGT